MPRYLAIKTFMVCVCRTYFYLAVAKEYKKPKSIDVYLRMTCYTFTKMIIIECVQFYYRFTLFYNFKFNYFNSSH